MTQGSIEIRQSSIRIVQLEVPVKEVADFLRSVPREEQGFTLMKAIEVGVFCLERGRENPPRPELIRRIAALLGGDADVLFRLADSTDPELAEYVNSIPKLPEFLRTAMAARLSSDDFQRLIDQIQTESSSTTSKKRAKLGGRQS